MQQNNIDSVAAFKQVLSGASTEMDGQIRDDMEVEDEGENQEDDSERQPNNIRSEEIVVEGDHDAINGIIRDE